VIPPVIAQPCPAIVKYIELYHPRLIPHLAPLAAQRTTRRSACGRVTHSTEWPSSPRALPRAGSSGTVG
jgi:hypothetical protein